MGIALALSWASMLAHNLYELPLTPLDVENAGPLLVAASLLLAYVLWPRSRTVHLTIAGWALLNLAVGGIATVLPLPILPFAPEQTLSHYLAHVVYSLGQVPAIVLALRAVRGGQEMQREGGTPNG